MTVDNSIEAAKKKLKWNVANLKRQQIDNKTCIVKTKQTLHDFRKHK